MQVRNRVDNRWQTPPAALFVSSRLSVSIRAVMMDVCTRRAYTLYLLLHILLLRQCRGASPTEKRAGGVSQRA